MYLLFTHMKITGANKILQTPLDGGWDPKNSNNKAAAFGGCRKLRRNKQ
jgi:hypothetical protein